MITGEILILEWLWGAEERISYLDSEDPGSNPAVPSISSVILDKSKVICHLQNVLNNYQSAFKVVGFKLDDGVEVLYQMEELKKCYLLLWF